MSTNNIFQKRQSKVIAYFLLIVVLGYLDYNTSFGKDQYFWSQLKLYSFSLAYAGILVKILNI